MHFSSGAALDQGLFADLQPMVPEVGQEALQDGFGGQEGQEATSIKPLPLSARETVTLSGVALTDTATCVASACLRTLGQEILGDAVNDNIGLFRQDLFNLIQIGFNYHVLNMILLELGKKVLQRLRKAQPLQNRKTRPGCEIGCNYRGWRRQAPPAPGSRRRFARPNCGRRCGLACVSFTLP